MLELYLGIQWPIFIIQVHAYIGYACILIEYSNFNQDFNNISQQISMEHYHSNSSMYYQSQTNQTSYLFTYAKRQIIKS